jgi:hypothetical protein
MLPLSNVCPSSLVIVCGTDDTFFHITVVPTLIVNIVGLKPKLPLLSFTIISICVEPETGVCVLGAIVGVGVSVGEGVTTDACTTGVGAAAVAPGVVFPHAVSKSAPTITNIRPRQACTGFNVNIFIEFIFSAF